MLLARQPRERAWYLLACLIAILAGLASRHFSHVLPAFLGKYPGDALWALMVFFGLGAIARRASCLELSLGALGFSFGIELLKLCRTPWLVHSRQSAIGHLVFGSVFSWQNLVAYTVGVLAGLVIELLWVARGGDSGASKRVNTSPSAEKSD
jgi:hypothetical protein